MNPMVSIESFIDEMLVVCPRCERCATVRPLGSPHQNPIFTSRRLTCPSCGLERSWEGNRITRTYGRPPVDDYFALPLWIQAPCRGHTLWAYNWRHLDFIANFIRATQRTGRDPLSANLPRWMKVASNRQAVLACTRRLRQERS